VTTVRGKFRPARAVLAKAKVEATEPPAAVRARSRADRRARQLALAYKIERAIEAGEVTSYGEVARALGISQPRVSQVMGLLLLPPEIQEGVLLGGEGVGIRELLRGGRQSGRRRRAGCLPKGSRVRKTQRRPQFSATPRLPRSQSGSPRPCAWAGSGAGCSCSPAPSGAGSPGARRCTAGRGGVRHRMTLDEAVGASGSRGARQGMAML